MFDDLNDNNDNNIEETNPDPNMELEYDESLDIEQADDTPSSEVDISVDSAEEQTEDSTPYDEESSQSINKVADNNSISADLIRGHINTIILRALYERDKYGYEIINDIESKSHGQYTLKQPTLYSALKRLENQGYIKAYWKTDEVTLGGRRKYFKLTDSGKAITEKNLSEWEYSRTIIDSLISDKSFDFAKPAPTPVDFSILRDSVSRVPTFKGEDVRLNEENKQQITEPSAQEILLQHPTLTTDSVSFVQSIEYGNTSDKPIENEKPVDSQNQPVQPTEAPTQPVTQQESSVPAEPQISSNQAAQNNIAENTSTPTQPIQNDSIDREEAAARKRAHENYLKLISEPVRTKPVKTEDTVPGYDNINSDKLLYNNRPETERDYKNLIDGIFFKTIYNGSVQTTYHSKQAEKATYSHNRNSVSSSRLVEKGANDGVSITPSNSANGSRAAKTTYNKGATLLKSSAVVLAIMIVEAILCFVFMGKLAVNWLYPATILAIGIIQFGVFAILAINGFGKHSVLPTRHGYISATIILTIISILIIAMLSFLLNMNTAVVTDILKMLVIPSIVSLNLTIFGISFKLFLG